MQLALKYLKIKDNRAKLSEVVAKAHQISKQAVIRGNNATIASNIAVQKQSETNVEAQTPQ